LLFGRGETDPRLGRYFLIAFAAIVLLPMGRVWLMKRRGETVHLDIPEREKRWRPFVFGMMCYLGALAILAWMGAPRAVLVVMWIYFFNTLVATAITRYWKISIHGMAAGGPTAALGYLVAPGFYWLILTLPFLVFSRVRLKAHTPSQVLAGFTAGLLLTFMQLKVMLP